MNNKNIKIAAVSGIAAAGSLFAGVPLNNLQGTGGIAFNPLAYTAGRPWSGGGGDATNEVEQSALDGIVSRPQVGAWYVNLTDASINWFALGAAFTIANRLEVSGGYGGVNAHRYGDNSINTYNVGAKLKFLDENAFDTSWVPALAVGGVYKYTDSKTVGALGLDHDGFDAYVVASKLITQTPIPVLLSVGGLVSDEVVTKILGPLLKQGVDHLLGLLLLHHGRGQGHLLPLAFFPFGILKGWRRELSVLSSKWNIL